MTDIVKDAFNDIEDRPITDPTGQIYGLGDLTNTGALAIGAGSKGFFADSSGIWLGAKKFADAPFSVDMEGNMIASSATFSQYLTKVGTSQAFSGSINVGIGNVLIDGVNKRILINDGTNDRILLGYQSGGF